MPWCRRVGKGTLLPCPPLPNRPRSQELNSESPPEFEYRTSVPGLCARAGGWPRACAGGLTWSVIGRAGVGLLRGFRVVHRVMHLMSGSVAGSARLALLGTHLLHLLTGRLARYALSQHGRCRGHGNSSRERNDRHFHDVLLRQAPSMQRNDPDARSSERMFLSAGFPASEGGSEIHQSPRRA